MTGDVPHEIEGVSYVHRRRSSDGDGGDQDELTSTRVPTTLDLFLAFGGATENGETSNDVCAMDCVTRRWVKLSTKGTKPSKRMGQASTLVNGRLFVHGGRVEGARGVDEEYLSDAYELNLDTLTWREVKLTGVVPSPRAFHTIATLSTMIVCFGGDNGKGFLQETFFRRLDEDEWRKPVVRAVPNKSNNPSTDATTKLEPSARACHTATPLADGDTMIVFGGIGLNNESQNDTWAWSAAQMTWSVVDPPSQEPEARFFHTTTVVGGGLAVLGGMTLNPLSQTSKRTPNRIFAHMYILTAAGCLKHPNWYVPKDGDLSKTIEVLAEPTTKSITAPAVAPPVTKASAVDVPAANSPLDLTPEKRQKAVAEGEPDASSPFKDPEAQSPATLTGSEEINPTAQELDDSPSHASHDASAVPPKKKLSAVVKLQRVTSGSSASMDLPSAVSKRTMHEEKGDDVHTNETADAEPVTESTPETKPNETPEARQQQNKKAADVERSPAVVFTAAPVASAAKVAAKDFLPVPGVSLAPPDDEDEDDIDDNDNDSMELGNLDEDEEAIMTGKSTPSPLRQSPAKQSAQAVPIPGVRMAPTHDDEWDDLDSDERMPSVAMSSDDDEREELSPSVQPIAWAKSDCGKYSIMIDRATGEEIRRIKAPPMSPPQSSAQRKRLASPAALNEQSVPKFQRHPGNFDTWTVKERLLARKFFEQFELTDKPKRYRGLTEEQCATALGESWNALHTLDRLGWLERARGPLSASKASAQDHDANDSDDEPRYITRGDRAMDTPTRADMEYAANLGEFRGNDLTMLGSHFRGIITGSFDTGYFATVTMEERSSREYRCVVYSPALASPRSRAPGESPSRPPLPAYCVPADDDTDVQNVVYTRNDGTHASVRAREAWDRSYAAGYRRRSNSPEFRQSSLEPID